MTILDLVSSALKEDLGQGDITTDGLGLTKKMGKAKLIAKQDLIISGRDFFSIAVNTLSPETLLHWHFKDGNAVLKGQNVCTIEGNLVPLLKSERVGLNFLQKFSGIATLTSQFVAASRKKPWTVSFFNALTSDSSTYTQILDTRKTTPLYRTYERQAVRNGGGRNHRFNLNDAILIKDNHIVLSGGISNAVNSIRESLPEHKIEVEASSLEQVLECVHLKVDRILLDNMSNQELINSLRVIPNSIETEASGNMSIERVKEIADYGLTYISVGAITHSAPVADLSLQFHWN